MEKGNYRFDKGYRLQTRNYDQESGTNLWDITCDTKGTKKMKQDEDVIMSK